MWNRSQLCTPSFNNVNFCFRVFYCDPKEKNHITRNINIFFKKKFVCEISIIIIILICQKLGSVGLLQQKVKLPSPSSYQNSEKLLQIN